VELSALLERCREGDQLAWEALVRTFQARVYGIACHYLGNPEDARDAAQEIFVRVYQSLGPEITEQRFLPWLIRIARNCCVDHIRRRKARRTANELSADGFHQIPDTRETPEEHWAADSRKRVIYLALQQLTQYNREIILLKDILGLSLEEIALQLGLPLGTVKSRSNRARIELAEKLAPMYRPALDGTGGIK
jgi:RNA polymerase sigma-70 factor, ECF subfamily